MRLVPKSLYGRLLATALLATLAALAFAAVAIGAVLERFVMHGLDQQLDAQIAILATAIGPDGAIDRGRIALAAPYDRADSGWGWRIDSPVGTIGSPAAPDPGPFRLEEPPPHLRPDRADRADEPRPLRWRAADGRSGHARALTIPTSAGIVRITASAPRAIVERPILAAMIPLLGSLALLGVALALSTLLQLRIGLRPLGRLREALAAVRGGSDARVPPDQPTELAPLADEINALLDANETALTNARGHVANLAHGLKTPLATLALALRDHDPDGSLGAQLDRIDQAVRHHLGRARAGTAGGASRDATPLRPAIDGLAQALAHIHAARPVTATIDIDPALSVAVDPQDLDELTGNLLDNAWRWAASRIVVGAGRDGQFIRLMIEDDGPGIPETTRSAALQPGRRLDESGDGHGFGLSIARELTELYGGSLMLNAAEGGGLRVTVTLPAA
ncbi:HAMP domain-containing histidine kinase [Sphingomonas sp. So64.6b]|uniref:sensor histidine kinase n=1 Tax=Sphingomonas sp. So64.6b TaxID=2997354 RepID=UPI001600BD4A|nr:HAMP domain-containing sensor histidine kinase [Sphingomonas sp. So64.6b]QNA84861.1 HAMP domain-containing histidine kinase [Sphingomonas sp. So64.6b]